MTSVGISIIGVSLKVMVILQNDIDMSSVVPYKKGDEMSVITTG